MSETVAESASRQGPAPYAFAQLPATVRSTRDRIISIRYRSDPVRLQALLPAPFTAPAGEITFRFRRSEGMDWTNGGGDLSVGAVLPVVYEGPAGRHEGVFWAALWEDDFIGVAAGLTTMGVSKRFGDIHAMLDVDGSSSCLLTVAGRPLIKLEAEVGDQLTGAPLDELKKGALRSTCFGLRQIPTVDQKAWELLQVTSFPVGVEIQRAWNATGSVELYDADPGVIPHEVSIMSALRDVPLRECLGASIYESAYDIHLGEGRVLESIDPARGPAPQQKFQTHARP